MLYGSKTPWNPKLWGSDAELRRRLVRGHPSLRSRPERHWEWVLGDIAEAQFAASRWWLNTTFITYIAAFFAIFVPMLNYTPDWLEDQSKYGQFGSIFIDYPYYAVPPLVIIPWLLAWPSGYVAGRWVLLRKIRRRFRWLRPVCPKCQYSLVGMEPSQKDGRPCLHCPECGNGLWLDVVLTPADLEPD